MPGAAATTTNTAIALALVSTSDPATSSRRVAMSAMGFHTIVLSIFLYIIASYATSTL